jgi:hypothetical protein
MVIFINFDFRGFKYIFLWGKLKNICQRFKSTLIKLFTTPLKSQVRLVTLGVAEFLATDATD